MHTYECTCIIDSHSTISCIVSYIYYNTAINSVMYNAWIPQRIV